LQVPVGRQDEPSKVWGKLLEVLEEQQQVSAQSLKLIENPIIEMLKGDQDLDNFIDSISKAQLSPQKKQKAKEDLLAEFEKLQSGISLKDYIQDKKFDTKKEIAKEKFLVHFFHEKRLSSRTISAKMVFPLFPSNHLPSPRP